MRENVNATKDELYDGRNKKAVAYRLELTRRSKGLNKQDFAALIGVSKNSYSSILSANQFPSIPTIYTACEKLDVDPNWILIGDSSNLRHSLADLLYKLHQERAE